MAQEHEFELDGGESGAVLELDRSVRFARRTAPRFVSGTPAPELAQSGSLSADQRLAS